MGKNKSKKNNNVFKVAGAKSLKPKTKAKAVTGHLKNIKVNTKEKIQAIDMDLVQLQDKVRQSGSGSNEVGAKPTRTKAKLNEKALEKYVEYEEKSEQVVDNFDGMQL